MASKDTGSFVQSMQAWRNSLPESQQWMVDSIVWSATRSDSGDASSDDVSGYAAWNWSDVESWLDSRSSQWTASNAQDQSSRRERGM